MDLFAREIWKCFYGQNVVRHNWNGKGQLVLYGEEMQEETARKPNSFLFSIFIFSFIFKIII